MRRYAMALSVLVLLNAAFTRVAHPMDLLITWPTDGTEVADVRPYVEGGGADQADNLWVVVHPMDEADFWVQPAITVREDGKWHVKIHLGRTGSADREKRFEVRAFSAPSIPLEEGMRLKDWPTSRRRSQMIEVTRR